MAHPELFSLRDLELRNVLKLSNYDIEYAAYSVRFGDVLESQQVGRYERQSRAGATAVQYVNHHWTCSPFRHVQDKGGQRVEGGTRVTVFVYAHAGVHESTRLAARHYAIYSHRQNMPHLSSGV
jgi:hypothetical protein